MTRPVWLRDFSLRFGLYDQKTLPMVEGMQDPVENFRDRLVALYRDLADQARLARPFEAENFTRAADLAAALSRNPSEKERPVHAADHP